MQGWPVSVLIGPMLLLHAYRSSVAVEGEVAAGNGQNQ